MLEKQGHVCRVQVRSVNSERHGVYAVRTIRSGPRPFTADDIDFLAAYVIPQEAWYVIPVGQISRLDTIYLRPHRQSRAQHFEKYREAWNLLDSANQRKLTRKKAEQ